MNMGRLISKTARLLKTWAADAERKMERKAAAGGAEGEGGGERKSVSVPPDGV